MKIEVTDLDIKQGTKRNMFYCPIALACERELLNAKVTFNKLAVSFKHVTVYGDKITKYELPDVATAFIRDFDSENPVSPITFEI